MADAISMVNVTMWRSDAIVLLDWLMSVEFDRLPFRHSAEKQALLDLFSRLEQQTDLLPLIPDQVAAARKEVNSDAGW